MNHISDPAGRAIIAEGLGGPGDFSAATLRLNRYNTISGVEFLDLNKIPREDCYYVSSPNGHQSSDFLYA
jgi:hypothetical protein